MRSSRVAWATEHIHDQSRQQGKTQTSNQKWKKGARWVISELQTENVQRVRDFGASMWKRGRKGCKRQRWWITPRKYHLPDMRGLMHT